MESVIGISTFIAVALGALTGLWLARHLPETHLSSESRTAVSVSMAVVGTLAALVMGLLISSASSSFNAKTDALHRLSVDIIRLDRALRQYGPGAESVRDLLRSYAQAKAEELSDDGDPSSLDLGSLTRFEALTSRALDLQPGDNQQRQAHAQALKVLDSIADVRWLLIEKANTSFNVVRDLADLLAGSALRQLWAVRTRQCNRHHCSPAVCAGYIRRRVHGARVGNGDQRTGPGLN